MANLVTISSSAAISALHGSIINMLLVAVAVEQPEQPRERAPDSAPFTIMAGGGDDDR